jgi:hypothetical protein
MYADYLILPENLQLLMGRTGFSYLYLCICLLNIYKQTCHIIQQRASAALAQLVERGTSNAEVVGSTPTGGNSRIYTFFDSFFLFG